MRSTFAFGFSALALGFGISSAEAAMCGRSCAAGGRFIPGPPSVCAANGLNYCGPSRGGPAVVVAPQGCRSVTVRRPDGTVITRREC